MSGDVKPKWDALDDLVDDLRETEPMSFAGENFDQLVLDWEGMRERIAAYARTAQVRALRDAGDELEASLPGEQTRYRSGVEDAIEYIHAKADEIEREAK